MLRAAARRGLIAKDADIIPAHASLYMRGMQVCMPRMKQVLLVLAETSGGANRIVPVLLA
jgi:hypothetical protein